MSPELTNFLFEAANVLTLAAVLGWLFFEPVRAQLDKERAARAMLAWRAEILPAALRVGGGL